MIDVGAHNGVALTPFVGDGWQVFAFEPDDWNRSILVEVYGRNRHVTIVPLAVSDVPAANLPFFASDVSSGISGLSAFHSSHEQRQTVDVTTLTEAKKTFGINEVDFLKIDTEGYDLFVLKGVDWSSPPRVVVCEFEDNKTLPLGYSVSDLFRYLRDKGYRVTISEWHPVTTYGARHKWKRFTDDVDKIAPDAWGNLIGYKDDDDKFADLGVDRIGSFSKRVFG
jgi:FkbM family methyltransferase